MKKTFKLEVEVTYDCAPEDEIEIKENLESIIPYAAGKGVLTQDTDAEVILWEQDVTEVDQ